MEIGAISPVRPESTTGANRTESGKTSEAERLREACRSFEAYFTASMFASMMKTTGMETKPGAQGQQDAWVWNLVSQTVAEESARGQGLGLSRQLEQSLTEKNCR